MIETEFELANYKDCPVADDELREDMIDFAKFLLDQPPDADGLSLRAGELSKTNLRGIWEHVQAGRVDWSPEFDGWVRFNGGAELEQWSSANANLSAELPKAVWLREGVVQIGDDAPIRISPQYAVVLDKLVTEFRGAANSKELDKFGGGSKMLREMLKAHPELVPYIELPGRKGKGGYRTTIRPLAEESC